MKLEGNEVRVTGGAEDPRTCAMPGCVELGAHPAPRSRSRLGEYIWLCLEHVRAYNGAWDYYAGMSEAEIEAHRRADVTWRRPTWPLGGGRSRPGGRLHDPLDALDGRADLGARPAPDEPALIVLDGDERRALAVLDLRPPIGLQALKARYKDLVKRLHPDANGGDKQAEDRLKLVNQAYRTLRKAKTF